MRRAAAATVVLEESELLAECCGSDREMQGAEWQRTWDGTESGKRQGEGGRL